MKMYQGKHHNRSRRRTGKSIALLVSLLLLATVTVGGTIAFLMDTAGPLANQFTPSEVTTKVEETLEGTTKKNVKIQNTGDTDAWIRAAVVITWQDADGNVYGQMPEAGDNKDYTITYKLDDGWVKGDDDFYYWTSPVAEKTGVTGVLIEECKSLRTKVVGETTYYLTVEIIGSGIQSKPASVFNTEWASSGLKVNDTDSDPVKWTLVKSE